MTKSKCIKCNITCKQLTQEGLCAGCYLIKYGKWAKEFSTPEKHHK